VLCDPRTGRWAFGARPPGRRTLVEVGRHGAPGAPPCRLIQGEAHDALSALRPDHAGAIRLCYIDPPYNTGHDGSYADRASDEVWLSCLEERLRLTAELLAPGAFLVAHVNVVEQAYLKVLLDELLGRRALVAQIAWQRAPDRTLLGQGSALVADQTEHLLVYARGGAPAGWPRPQRAVPFPPKTLTTYGRVLEPSPGDRPIAELTDRAGETVRLFAHDAYRLETVPRAELLRAAALPGGRVGAALRARFPRLMRLSNQQEESTFQRQLLERMREPGVLYRAEYRQARGKHRGARARHYLNGQVVLWLRDVARLEDGRLLRVCDLNNFWTADEIPATGIAGEGGVVLRRGKKPERLLERVIGAFSRPGDWVLDYFAGSGTTAAVAERLGRRWLTVEVGAAARALAEPRLARAVAASGGGFVVNQIEIR
jgi:adenine-specific DNA-methyltransferase